jgi:multisubunit Na+/H+ antiporter MnhF subunit
MTQALHTAASDPLPSFITAPGDTDVLMVVMAAILVVAVLMFGILFFRLHTLPERIAHKSNKIQFEIVAVLGLISLFTHMHIFWIAGLLLALIDIPDFSSFGRIAGSVERIANATASGAPPDPARSAGDGQAVDSPKMSDLAEEALDKPEKGPAEVVRA